MPQVHPATIADRCAPNAQETSAPSRLAPKIVRDGPKNGSVSVGQEDQLRTLYGTRTEEAAAAILKSALNALGEKGAEYFELMPAMAVELEPRDPVESMLVTQMAATHIAMTQMSLKLHYATSYDTREAFERSMTRLSRTFLAQMEQLKKYLSTAQQAVRVEQVVVNEGRPLSAMSATGGGRRPKSDTNPMNPVHRLYSAPRCHARSGRRTPNPHSWPGIRPGNGPISVRD